MQAGLQQEDGLCLTPAPLENKRRPRAKHKRLPVQPPLPFHGSLGQGLRVPARILPGLLAPPVGAGATIRLIGNLQILL